MDKYIFLMKSDDLSSAEYALANKDWVIIEANSYEEALSKFRAKIEDHAEREEYTNYPNPYACDYKSSIDSIEAYLIARGSGYVLPVDEYRQEIKDLDAKRKQEEKEKEEREQLAKLQQKYGG